MNVTIRIQKEECSRIDNSSLNIIGAMYHLPFKLSECNIIHEQEHLDETTTNTSLGYIQNGNYIPKYWLQTYHDDLIEIDTVLLSTEDKWT